MTNTQKLTRTAIMLAILFAVQYFKNISPFISGPVVNFILLISTFYIGLPSGILLSIIAPISSYFIANAAAMTAIMTATKFTALPVIIIGNLIFIFISFIFYKEKKDVLLIIGMALGSVVKWLFMLLSAEYILKPVFSDNLIGKTAVFISKTFGTLQFTAAISGSILFFIIHKILKKLKI